jgi:5-formyltetrahydrofolate cyclo-ligase
MEKAELRRSLLKTRQSLSIEEWQQKSDRICFHLQSSTLFTQAKTILAYFSFRQEPNLSPLFTTNHHCWGFPRCVGDTLCWHIVETGNLSRFLRASVLPVEPTGVISLQIGAYGILEPLPNTPTLQPDEVDLILVPAVACDYQGYRLGYGGGYYDRLLSLPEWASKPTIGVVFEFAYLPHLPSDTWDIQLHGVCTEKGLRMTE